MMLHDPDSSARILAIFFDIFAEYHFLELEPQSCSVFTHYNPPHGCLLFPTFLHLVPIFEREDPNIACCAQCSRGDEGTTPWNDSMEQFLISPKWCLQTW